MMRPTTSIGPPAANGTTIVTGRTGQSCADAATVAIANAASEVKMMRVDAFGMVVSAPDANESSIMMHGGR
jgi:tRNA-binding EMAP/Myf-like protein